MSVSEIVEKIRKSKRLEKLIRSLCDIDFYDNFVTPEVLEQTICLSISGGAFASDASGGEFVLLEDGSIGYIGSEGEVGRVAEDVETFLMLIVNCSSFHDYSDIALYTDEDALGHYTEKMEAEASFMESCETETYNAMKEEVADFLGIILYKDIKKNVLMKFYTSATREPKFYAVFKEADGSETISEDLIR